MNGRRVCALAAVALLPAALLAQDRLRTMPAYERAQRLARETPTAVRGGNVAVTTDGGTASRVKYGTASWVYGEELSQRTAMWWSPDNRKLAFYRFDEASVPDYYLEINQTRLQSTLDVEAYPKAGVPNPIVDL